MPHHVRTVAVATPRRERTAAAEAAEAADRAEVPGRVGVAAAAVAAREVGHRYGKG